MPTDSLSTTSGPTDRTSTSQVVWFIFDVETTGLKPGQDAYVLQLGVVVRGPGDLYRSYQSKINPMVSKMDPKALAVHKITLESCSGMPTLEKGLEQVSTLLDDICPKNTVRVLVTYNGHSFDLPVIVHHLLRDKVDPRKCLDKLRVQYTLDVLRLSERLPGRFKPPVFLSCGKLSTDPAKYPLGKLYKILQSTSARSTTPRLGLDLPARTSQPFNLLAGAHDAEVDCKILLAICEHPEVSRLIEEALLNVVTRNNDDNICSNFSRWMRRFLSTVTVRTATLPNLPRKRTLSSAQTEQVA